MTSFPFPLLFSFLELVGVVGALVVTVVESTITTSTSTSSLLLSLKGDNLESNLVAVVVLSSS